MHPPGPHLPARCPIGVEVTGGSRNLTPASSGDGGRPTVHRPRPQKTAERIERRLRLRVTASDVDATAQRLWSRSLESERERRVTDRVALTGGSLKTIRGHVSRDLDREIAYEMERDPERVRPAGPPSGEMSPDEVTWEATRLNIILANKGYSDSDVTRWWNFTRHRELGDQTIAEAWRDGDYGSVSRLVESLPDKHGVSRRLLHRRVGRGPAGPVGARQARSRRPTTLPRSHLDLVRLVPTDQLGRRANKRVPSPLHERSRRPDHPFHDMIPIWPATGAGDVGRQGGFPSALDR